MLAEGRILVVKTHAFGDAMLCTPAVRELIAEESGHNAIIVLTSTEALPHEYLFKLDPAETVRDFSVQSPLAKFLMTNGASRQRALPGLQVAWSVDRISLNTFGCDNGN